MNSNFYTTQFFSTVILKHKIPTKKSQPHTAGSTAAASAVLCYYICVAAMAMAGLKRNRVDGQLSKEAYYNLEDDEEPVRLWPFYDVTNSFT